MFVSTLTWAQKPVKYQVLFGNKALPQKDKL